MIPTDDSDKHCVFPFTYKGVVYTDSCVYMKGLRSDYHWCYTNAEQREWGMCGNMTKCERNTDEDIEGKEKLV